MATLTTTVNQKGTTTMSKPRPEIGTCAECGARMMEMAGKGYKGLPYKHLPRHRKGIPGAVHSSIRLTPEEACPGSLSSSVEVVTAQRAISTPFTGTLA